METGEEAAPGSSENEGGEEGSNYAAEEKKSDLHLPSVLDRWWYRHHVSSSEPAGYSRIQPDPHLWLTCARVRQPSSIECGCPGKPRAAHRGWTAGSR
ncbi:hypothetical protein GCM10010435_83460 [Winogradskya consettensis]|uniref:Uncharacterized protein n=1 Tax=Winogradskya consettensis TaxID=113560 RepID=A0A919W651_9ACTN|nr:hypothetical protein Aco04nite_80640 [Actinoplanes consettensis]